MEHLADLKQLTAQCVADQRRATIKNSLLSEIIPQQIRRKALLEM